MVTPIIIRDIALISGDEEFAIITVTDSNIT